MAGIVILGAFITAAVACCYVIKVAFSNQQQNNNVDIDEELQHEARWLEYKERREMEERMKKK